MRRSMEYVGFRGRCCDIVIMNDNMSWFDYRDDEPKLPRKGAFCKKCAKETAKPVHAIYMNGKPAYALRCEKCGSEYPMYQAMYIERYVGFDMKVGHAAPTHGQTSVINTMDRRAKNYYRDADKRVEEKLCAVFHCTPEEYRDLQKQRNEKRAKWEKKAEREAAECHAKWEAEKRETESNKRKELIKQGVLKYVKGAGLVNTKTGEVIKL